MSWFRGMSRTGCALLVVVAVVGCSGPMRPPQFSALAEAPAPTPDAAAPEQDLEPETPMAETPANSLQGAVLSSFGTGHSVGQATLVPLPEGGLRLHASFDGLPAGTYDLFLLEDSDCDPESLTAELARPDSTLARFRIDSAEDPDRLPPIELTRARVEGALLVVSETGTQGACGRLFDWKAEGTVSTRGTGTTGTGTTGSTTGTMGTTGTSTGTGRTDLDYDIDVGGTGETGTYYDTDATTDADTDASGIDETTTGTDLCPECLPNTGPDDTDWTAETGPLPGTDLVPLAGDPGDDTQGATAFEDRRRHLIQNAIRSLRDGFIAWTPSLAMRQGRSEVVKVRISEKDLPDLLTGLPAAPETRVEGLRTSSSMIARLTGDEGAFRIRRLTGEQQPIVSPYSEWAW